MDKRTKDPHDNIQAAEKIREVRGNHSQELGHRSRALVDQLRGTVQAHEIEAVEQRISIAVENNKLLQSQSPDEFIKATWLPGH